MGKTILHIERIEATDLFRRLDRLESAIGVLVDSLPTCISKQETPDYITRVEVSRMLRISLVTVHDWTRKGLLQAYKLGNRVYYKRAEVEQAMIKKRNTWPR